MICWLLGWQKRGKAVGHEGFVFELVQWQPVVYGALPDLLPGEPCKPTLVVSEKTNVTCERCLNAKEKRDHSIIDRGLKARGLPPIWEDPKP